jgi:hypothetical protein
VKKIKTEKKGKIIIIIIKKEDCSAFHCGLA